MRILGTSAFYHDSAAAILVDGQLVAAAQQERFSRVKNDPRFPSAAIDFCLRRAGLQPSDLDAVAYYERPLLKMARTAKALRWNWPRNASHAVPTLRASVRQNADVRARIVRELGVPADRILFVPHHVSHAASSFLSAGVADAAIVTLDAVGEWTTTMIARGSSTATSSEVEPLLEVDFPDSLGLFYSTFTQFCGFEVNEGEYMMMGLAPYGAPRFVDEVRRTIEVADDGAFRLDLDYFEFLDSEDRMFSDRLVALLGEPSAKSDGSIDPRFADIAASVQAVTEDAIVSIARTALAATGSRNLCLAGGVALNSVAMGRLSRDLDIDSIYIQPAAGDAGGSLGAALFAHYCHFGAPPSFVMDRADWGADHPDPAADLTDRGIAHDELTPDSMAETVAEMLEAGQIVGLHQGRFEWGPRALGNRSILADPRHEATKDVVNARIKYREAFRPFAPAILEEKAGDWFAFDPAREALTARFMTTVHPYREGMGERVAAVDHVGTGRLQTVPASGPPLYRSIIEAFEARTGIPIVLNTSFNVRGQPIVGSPSDAIDTFYGSGIDALVLGNALVTKAASPKTPRPSRRTTARDRLVEAAPMIADYLPADLEYDPYLFTHDRPLRQTESYTTDRLGYRRTVAGDTVVDCDTWNAVEDPGLFVGGSTAFGTGTTGDASTVASRLSEATRSSFLNVAVRGVTSTHEVAAAQYFLGDAGIVVLLTGFNNLGAALGATRQRQPFAPYWGEGRLERLNEAEGWGRSKLPAVTDPIAAAVDAHRRDLDLMLRLAEPSTRFVFALQPVAPTIDRTPPRDELASFEAMQRFRPGLSDLRDSIVPIWSEYATTLRAAVEPLAAFVDTGVSGGFDGWCFVDMVHLTDLGSAVVADAIVEALQ